MLAEPRSLDSPAGLAHARDGAHGLLGIASDKVGGRAVRSAREAGRRAASSAPVRPDRLSVGGRYGGSEGG